MRTENRRPAWWQLYLLGMVMLALLVLGATARLPELGHEVAAFGALLLVYGLVALWLRTNAAALVRVNRPNLLQRPDQKVVRETPDEELMPVYDHRPRPDDAPATGERQPDATGGRLVSSEPIV